MTNDDNNRYNITQIAAAFQVSQETIRLWCTEFERHLSPRANPGNRQKRNFTADDIEILALIAELKNEGMTFSNIHASLDNGERGEPPIILVSDLEESNALILREAEKRMVLQIRMLENQLDTIKTENTQLHEQLERIKQEFIAAKEAADTAIRERLRHEVRSEFLNEQVEKLEKQVKELLTERSKLEREIGSMESDLRRKDDDE